MVQKIARLFLALALICAPVHAFAAGKSTTDLTATAGLSDGDLLRIRHASDTEDTKMSTTQFLTWLGGKNMSIIGPTTATQFASSMTGFTGTGNFVRATAPTFNGLNMTAGNTGVMRSPAKVTAIFYTGGVPGSSITAANATPLVDGTEYASIGIANAPLTIKTVSFKTSSTSANVGASIKVCVYAGDGAADKPSTLIGSTAAGTSIADSATSTDVKIALDTPAVVTTPIYWVALLQTSTTGLRFQYSSGSDAFSRYTGSTSNSLGFTGSPVFGFTVAQAYASGCASPFGTAVGNVNPNLNPAFFIEIN